MCIILSITPSRFSFLSVTVSGIHWKRKWSRTCVVSFRCPISVACISAMVKAFRSFWKAWMRRWRKSIRTVSARMISNMRNWTMTKWSCWTILPARPVSVKGLCLPETTWRGMWCTASSLAYCTGGNANSVFCRWHMLIVVRSISWFRWLSERMFTCWGRFLLPKSCWKPSRRWNRTWSWRSRWSWRRFTRKWSCRSLARRLWRWRWIFHCWIPVSMHRYGRNWLMPSADVFVKWSWEERPWMRRWRISFIRSNSRSRLVMVWRNVDRWSAMTIMTSMFPVHAARYWRASWRCVSTRKILIIR